MSVKLCSFLINLKIPIHMSLSESICGPTSKIQPMPSGKWVCLSGYLCLVCFSLFSVDNLVYDIYISKSIHRIAIQNYYIYTLPQRSKIIYAMREPQHTQIYSELHTQKKNTWEAWLQWLVEMKDFKVNSSCLLG